MNIGILGYGKEGQSAEKYFISKGHEIAIFDNFHSQDLDKINFQNYDLLLRSPSVHPRPHFSSMTRYFFEHCPCPIIGVTGTKGKGTTCSMITTLLKNLGEKVYLVGNIGTPALDVLDQLTSNSAIVYEMSSFQLWDLEKSPHIAVILPIEPDHLNIHDDYNDYVNAKANIAKHQSSDDYCIYYQSNPDSAKIAQQSPAHKLAYPINDELIQETVARLSVPGFYNRENAQAALLAVASYYNLSITDFIQQNQATIHETLENFQGLPHRLQFLRELNGIKYYDDNFSTTPTSLQVALQAFPDQNIVLIAGGRDKTNNADLPEIAAMITNSTVIHTVLIGESGHELHQKLPCSELADNLKDAIDKARRFAESQKSPTLILMSPAAASFDMFENVYARGAEFQKLVQELS